MNILESMYAPITKGYWQIGGQGAVHIFLVQRPRWLTRLMCKLLLEWVWVDQK